MASIRLQSSGKSLAVSALISLIVHVVVALVAISPFDTSLSDGEKEVFAVTLVEVPLPGQREPAPTSKHASASRQIKNSPPPDPAPETLPSADALVAPDSPLAIETPLAPLVHESEPLIPANASETAEQGAEFERLEPQPLFPPTSPLYPNDAMTAGLQGCVLVRVSVTPQGAVQAVEIVASDIPGVFDDAVVASYKHAQYLPARVNGTPVEAQILGVTTFQLEGGPTLFCEMQFLELAKSLNRQQGLAPQRTTSSPLNAAQSR